MKKIITFFVILSIGFNPANAQCNYSISLTDDYGDGWQGGQVEITVAGVSAGIFTLSNGAGPETYFFSVLPGDQINATFTAGQWPQENEYHIYDADGTEIFADGTGGNPPTANNTVVGTGSCPSCPLPGTLSSTNIQTTTAVLNWIENGSSTQWNIEYGPAGFTQGSGTLLTNITTNPYNLNGLSPATPYDWYVRSVCGSGDTSNWAGPSTFTTQCNAVSAPYFENFESGGLLPSCWGTNSSTGETWNFNSPGGNDHTASNDHTTGSGYFAWIDDSEYPATSDITLESPLIDISGLITPTLYFWCYSDNEGAGTNAILYVDVWDGTQWNNHVATYTGNTNGWEKETIDLSTLTVTGPIQIRFVADEANGNYTDDIAIDDVEIINIETCPRPDNLTASNITTTTAVIGWNETGSATEWEIEYGLAGFSLGTGIIISSVTDNPHTITGLSVATNYEFYVRSVCSAGDSSLWAGPITFSTTMGNPTPCEVGMPTIDAGCIDIPIMVSGNSTQMGTSVVLQEVHLIIQHTYDMDLIVSLESPNGQIDTLTRNFGGGGDNYGIIDGTCSQYTNFTMSASTPISSGTPPFVGNYIPADDFSIFNDDSDPNGIWILHICDVWPPDQGTFEFAELVFNNLLPPAVMKINEIDVDQGSNDTAEFVELYDGGYGNFPLDDYCLIFYDGASDTVYATYNLDGYTTDTNGYFVLGDSTVANVQMFLNSEIQDGADAIALYQDSSASFPIGSGITTNNISDAVVYSTDDPFDIQLLQLLNSGQPQINENILGHSNIYSLSRLPNGSGGQQNTNTYYVSIPTPGDSNLALPVISWNNTIFNESIFNDGSIPDSISLSLQNDKFTTVGILQSGTDYIAANIPAGLTLQIETSTDSTATIRLLGNAVLHMDSNDVNDFQIGFTNNVFVYADTGYILNFEKDSLYIDFIDQSPPMIVWNDTVFYEDTISHGHIQNILSLILLSDTFTVDTGILPENVFYTTANVPQGLQVEIQIMDSVHAQVSLIGNAVNNDEIDDINDLTINFSDTLFESHTAQEITNALMNSLVIDFTDGLSDSCEILSFSFTLQTAPATIDNGNRTINIEVNQYADLSYLVPSFSLSQGATAYIGGIEQISGITANNYSDTVIYNVMAEDSLSNCDWTVIVTQPNAIQEEKLHDLKVFPNPTNDKLNIISPTLEISQIQLISVTGETILQSDASNKQQVYILSLRQVSSGIYTLKLQYDKGIIYKKIIITK